jgi:hypothetical protein
VSVHTNRNRFRKDEAETVFIFAMMAGRGTAGQWPGTESIGIARIVGAGLGKSFGGLGRLERLRESLGGILVGVQQSQRVEKHPFGIAASKPLEDFAGVPGLLHDHA